MLAQTGKNCCNKFSVSFACVKNFTRKTLNKNQTNQRFNFSKNTVKAYVYLLFVRLTKSSVKTSTALKPKAVLISTQIENENLDLIYIAISFQKGKKRERMRFQFYFFVVRFLFFFVRCNCRFCNVKSPALNDIILV